MSATAQLMVNNLHQAEADFANTVLLASVRPLTIAFGAYQLGYGGAALSDGEYATGLANIGLGTLAIYGANAARAPTASTTVANEVKVVENAGANSVAAATRVNVLNNIADSQVARASSNFGTFISSEGKLQEAVSIWPPNRGRFGPVETTELQPGTLVDRYGSTRGTFVAPEGTPFVNRALPSYYENSVPYFQSLLSG